MNTQEAIIKILQENGNRPLHYCEITQQAMAKGYYKTTGKTPENSVGAVLATKTAIFEKCETAGAGYYRLKNYKTPEKVQEKGFVYILTNPSFREDWVKIGRSERPVNTRSKELYNTAVPLPFEIYATIQTAKYKEVELFVHNALDHLTKSRICSGREFFKVEPKAALAVFQDIAKMFEDAIITEYKDNKPIEKQVAINKNGNDALLNNPPKRGRFKFSMANVPIGSTVVFVPTDTKVRVASDNQIEYNGKLYKLSAFTRDFIPADKRNESGAYQGAKYFSYNGKILDDLRTEMENNLINQ